MDLDWGTIIGTGTLLAVVGYFLKKIDAKVEASTRDINLIRIQMAGLSSEFSKSITETFNLICKERQNSCSIFHESRFKLLEEGDKHNCQKILYLESERKDAWQEQKKWNDKIERKLFNTSS